MSATELAGRGQPVTRRGLLAAGVAGLLFPVAGCSSNTAGRQAVDPGETPQRQAGAGLAALERRFGARVGVYAHDTGSGATVTYHADERFPMCSTYKVLAAAAVLHHRSPAELGSHISYRQADLVPLSPVAAAHVTTGLTLEQVCRAAVSDSDNTAGNLLLDNLGGPAGVTSYAHLLGDRVTRLDRTEPALNQATPGDRRDTTSPRAIATDYAAMVLGAVLPPTSRSLLTRWLTGSTTGAHRIRAAVPANWRVGDKTGTGGYGTANDIAILWPPERAPIVLAIMSARAAPGAQPSSALIAQAARTVLPGL